MNEKIKHLLELIKDNPELADELDQKIKAYIKDHEA
jgi:hypothetical protein